MQYSTRNIQNKPRKWRKVGAIGIIIISLVVGWLIIIKNRVEAPIKSPLVVKPKNDKVESVNAKYMFSGTVVPARAVENEARQTNGSIDYNQPFSKMSTFNPKQYNEWLVDMECPITKNNLTYQEQVTQTVFNCRPEFLPAMRQYFSIFNFANNHIYDGGKENFSNIQKYANEAGFQHLGNQDPGKKEDICEVMAMGVNIKMKDGSEKDGKIPIALCAWHYFERPPEDGELEVAKQYAELMPVFGFMHIGQEYVATAGSDQQKVGRSIIDNGAEFVIGNSPHWVQNSDVYKEKLIFYSTGNFIFDQLDTETNRGANIEVSMDIDYDENVAKWLDLGGSCSVPNDNCLAEAKKQGLTKIKPNYKYGLIASVTGYRQITKKAPADIQQAVEQRANWLQTINNLGQQ